MPMLVQYRTVEHLLLVSLLLSGPWRYCAVCWGFSTAPPASTSSLLFALTMSEHEATKDDAAAYNDYHSIAVDVSQAHVCSRREGGMTLTCK
jgi:hypothetical protein